VLTATLLFQLAALAHPIDPQIFSGIHNELTVRVPRIEQEVRIDGILDEVVWHGASVLSGFSQYEPNDGRPALDSTQVLVWYSRGAIYFGIRAFEAHGAVNATLADRDHIASDDYIQILIDTYNDRRQALVFGVNPRGVQSDGIRLEGQVQQGSGINSGSARTPDATDLTPDFIYESKGRLTEYGYEVEVRVPFKSISYQSKAEQDWGVNVLRRVQHSGHLDSWAPAKRGNASFLSQSGKLLALTELHRGVVLDVNPELSSKLNGTPAPLGSSWRYDDPTRDVGFNLRAGLSANMSAAGTVNPDFSQVESDVALITSNQRFAQFVPEKRPFFLEGIEKFDTPNQLIYTRRIVEPMAGAKVAGKVGDMNVGFLSAVDATTSSTSGVDHPLMNFLRLRRDLGKQSTLGLAYTDRIDGDNYNRVAALDARVLFSKQTYVQVQGAGSFNRANGKVTKAPLFETIFNHSGKRLSLNYKFTGIHPDFITYSGFVPRIGNIAANMTSKLLFYGKRGSLVENWSPAILITYWSAYHELDRAPVETHLHFQNNFTLHGGWAGTLTYGWETYAFDETRYTNFYEARRIGSVTDTIHYDAAERINDVYGLITRISTPEFKNFSANLGVNRWHDVGFIEAVPVLLLRMNTEVNWRPTGKLRVQGLYSRLQLDRRSDHSRLSLQQIPRLKVEYQVSRPLFLRYVGQYTATDQNTLRDPVTGAPLLVRSSSGYSLTKRSLTNSFRSDFLFSYRPRPGTVVFAGYGSSMSEPNAFNFTDLQRVNDGFFVKLSYLFRR
jgi:hypothetical protein